MATSEEVAKAYQARQSNLATATARSVVRQYSQLDEHALSESWAATVGPRVQATVEQAQLTAAQAAAPYLAELAAAQGMPIAAPLVVASALAGIASDGRPLASLLYLPILLIKNLLGQGVRYPDAFGRGIAFAGVIAATQVSDAGRAGVTVGMTADKRWVSYTRVVNLPACSRCIVLAGKEYSYSTGFQRHPRCDCEMWPLTSDDPAHLLIRSPEELFAEMSPEQQDKAFTKAGAEAIRLGADIGQIVNARRGMTTTAEGRKVTTEGTTRRGYAGRRMGSTRGRKSAIRPMPEQILADAGGDRDEALRLLHRFGYLVDLPEQPVARSGSGSESREAVNAGAGSPPDTPSGDGPTGSGPPPDPPRRPSGRGGDWPPIGRVLGSAADQDVRLPGQPRRRTFVPADHDFRFIADPDQRATALLQYEYNGRKIVEHVLRNMEEPTDPFEGIHFEDRTVAGMPIETTDLWLDQKMRSPNVRYGEYDLHDLRRDLYSAAYRLRRWLSTPTLMPTPLVKGLRMRGTREEIASRYREGRRERLRLSSFTSVVADAAEYALDLTGEPFRPVDATPVIFAVHDAYGVQLSSVGRLADLDEQILDGEIEMLLVEDGDPEFLVVHWQWIGN